MKAFHWFEAKQLDRVTNYSARTECIDNFLAAGVPAFYYCTFSKNKVYYGLEKNIRYLGMFRNKYLKYVEFRTLLILKSIYLIISSNDNVLMVNQDLVNYMRPAVFINKILKKRNKFILDVRTLPTSPETFDRDMKKYDQQISVAVSKFDGMSFITPFMTNVSLQSHPVHPKTVTWSSGVNMDLFNADKFDYGRDTDAFRLFYHGGISVSRGNLNFIKACERVIDKGYKIELIQIGKIVDGELKKYIKEHGIGIWCKLYDAVPLEEIPALVAKCDLPVLPFPNFMAWRVSSPIKLMEYLAMGKPVLAPDMECFTDILADDSGMVYYYDTNDDNAAEAIANAIIDRVKNHQPHDEFVRYVPAIEYVRKYFTWKAQVNNLICFCENLCQETN